MRSRAFVLFAVAFALAAASAYLARSWIADQAARERPVAASAPAGPPMTRIVVAGAPLAYAAKIRRHDLRLVDWPVESVPHGAFASVDEILGEAAAGEESRFALRALQRGEPVLENKLSGLGARAGLSSLIAPGLRAATIRVNDVNGVAGFVLPGDRVDVLLTRDGGGGPGRPGLATDVLLQNMKVLGIDQDANAERAKPAVVRAVTLEVTQSEAQKLTLAQKLGTLSLALRHASAADTGSPRTITAHDLPLVVPRTRAADNAFREPDVQPAERSGAQKTQSVVTHSQPAVSSIRIIRGLNISIYEVAVEAAAPGMSAASQSVDRRAPPGSAGAPSAPGSALPPTVGPQVETAIGAQRSVPRRGLTPTTPLRADRAGKSQSPGPGGDG